MYDDEKWISEQFGQADLGDPRRARRAQMLALNMLKAPGKGIPEQTQTWGGAKAAYRLFGRPEVTREALMQPHFEQTLQACEARPGLMLFVQDTTELDFTHMRAAEGYAPIGNHAGCGLMALGASGRSSALPPNGVGLAAAGLPARAPRTVSNARSAKALSPRSGPWFWSRSGIPPRWPYLGQRW